MNVVWTRADLDIKIGFLTRHFSNYYTLHRSDLAARAAPLDPRLVWTSKKRRLLTGCDANIRHWLQIAYLDIY